MPLNRCGGTTLESLSSIREWSIFRNNASLGRLGFLNVPRAMRLATLAVVSALVALATLFQALSNEHASTAPVHDPAPVDARQENFVTPDSALQGEPSGNGDEIIVRDEIGINAPDDLNILEKTGAFQLLHLSAAALAPAEAASQVRGIATYYGLEDGFTGGTTYCGRPFSPWDPNVAAVSPGRYPCGTRLLVTEAQSKRSVTIVGTVTGIIWT